ncbi:amino acid decarboxylase [Leifsonia shinshuensis]|uniref:aminotransferase class I/II-fold pyridoxal phosphate-dependent enzyme n=1 Tax=Leifsonia shinshuensis TaxID=150026 RepID=UPI00285B7D60|nr:amino acid decarboxylase [Leifsonia shinshuensis]MDR6971616.1 arginine/lysine/ornithine decarboxylase [Leifsonia shinshuensis]
MAPTRSTAVDGARPLPAADLRQWETPYADALDRHAAREPLALMVPGHGGDELGLSARLAEYFGTRPLQLDVPMLIDDIDLGEDSPLSRSLDLAAEAWGARRTWFLTGGASQANRVAALAVRGLGENILTQRSAHSSFSDGILSAGLVPSFVLPSIDTVHGVAHGVSPAALDDALAAAAAGGRPADAVYIVSPSYFGAVADVAGLARVAHAHGAPLIVDGAWGPHLGFHPDLPESPARLGADLVVSSTHKLGGSLTQSAMLHLGHGAFADALEPLIERAVSITASTSTSSLLQASLDIARHSLATGGELIGRSIAVADAFRDALRDDPRFGVLSDGFGAFDDIVAVDPLRVAIDVSGTGVSGHWLRQRLLDADGIFFEMSTATSLVALIGAGKTPDLVRAHRALVAAVDSEEARAERSQAAVHGFPALPEAGTLRMSPRDAFFAETELVPAAEAVGRVSADTLAAYPPGIPNLIPGEEITAQTVAFLQAVAASPSGYVRGAADNGVERFRVTRQD